MNKPLLGVEVDKISYEDCQIYPYISLAIHNRTLT